MLKNAIKIFRARGVSGLLHATSSRVRTILAGRAKSFSRYKNQFLGKSGIEIGGPSQVFSRRGIFPVYPLVATLDNCNFCSTTVWGNSGDTGYRFDPQKPAGRQYITEATAMEAVPSKAYDFVLSSHMLEHCANPIRALSEWKRLTKDDGILVLLLPEKSHTFDRRRPVTTMAHLIDDFNAGTAEDDLTHLPEILALHDLKRDPEAGDMASFTSRSKCNLENRCLHHHVFDTHLAITLLSHIGFATEAVEELPPHHILLVARNIAPSQVQ